MVIYSINMLIQWKDEDKDWDDPNGKKIIERVLWIDERATHLITINIDPTNTTAWPCLRKRDDLDWSLKKNEARIITQDPFFRLYRQDKDLKPEHCDQRDKAMASIRDIVEKHSLIDLLNPKVLGPSISEVAEKAGKDKKIFYIRLRRYWQGGQTENALLPLWYRCGGKGKERIINDSENSLDHIEKHVKRGRPTKWAKRHNDEPDGINMTTSILENIRRSKRLFYEQKKMSFADTYHEFCKTYFSSGEEIRNGILTTILKPAEETPQMNQFRYWFYKDHDLERALKARLGQRRFQETMRPLVGTVRGNVHGPGSMFYYDATVADIYLRSPFDRTIIIGRPIVHVIIDLFSGLIVGFAVLMEGPCWLGAMLALENMVCDKVKYCAEHQFFDVSEEDWPCQHLPRVITSDRGELYSPRAKGICRVLKIRTSATSPYRPTWKAAVERTFRTLNDLIIQFLPGHVHQRSPGEPDYRYEAQLTIEEFRQILISGIVRYNRSHEVDTRHFTPDMIAAQVEPYPSAIWQWGLENRMGDLFTLPLDEVRKSLLEDGIVPVKRDGLHFRRLRYISPTGEQEQWYLKAQQKQKTERKKIYFDRRTCKYVYVLLDNGSIELCTLHPDDAQFGNLDWYEVEDRRAREADAERTRRTYVRQQRVNDEAYRDAILAKAAQETREALEQTNPGKAGQLREGRDHKDLVAADERRRGQWVFGEADHVQKSSPAHPGADSTVNEATQRRLALLDDEE